MQDPISTQFRAAHIESALQEKFLSVQSSAIQYTRFAFFLDMGQAGIQSRAGEVELSGPALFWGPVEDETRIRLHAGSTGAYVFLGERVMAQTIESTRESRSLRPLSEQKIVVTFSRGDPNADEMASLFGRMVNEGRIMQVGAEIAIAANIRLLLVELWRKARADGDGHSAGNEPGVIDAFRQLVEAHFRSRWTAGRYARELGITYDRLHDHCMRTVGKPPARLIRERSLYEAQILLHRRSLSNERIAAVLGFSSASQFSHFYKSLTGSTPGAFRKQLQRRPNAEQSVSDFSDWP